ncbi:unnamed protein product [Camellia sinensis]
MEEEKNKRKRSAEGDEVGGGGGRRRKEREEAVKAVAVEAAPTEEEVEEFFAILRRMHVAVKYFENSGGDGVRKVKGRWGAALEAEVKAAADGVKAAEESVVNGVRENGVLDLNAVPEAESNSFRINRVSSKSVPSTPYEMWTGKKPDLGNLRPWGSAAYIHNASHKFGKLGPRGKKCIFIRYSEHSKGYVFVGEHPDGSVTEIESRDVDFLEEDFPSRGEVTREVEFYEMEDLLEGAPSSLVENEEIIPQAPRDSGSDLLTHGLDPMDEDSQLRRSKRGAIPRRRFEIEGEAFMIAPSDEMEPKNLKEALSSPASKEWSTAMEEEIESMKKNHVWDLVDLPLGRKTIGNKWVLKIKRKADGSIERYKARLVAKGYTQREGVDYEETFSPVVRFASIRLILAIVAQLDLEPYQMDVKTAFLNGELDEEIYMDQPEGFVAVGQERKVCKLQRSIYGLKQSSRQWNLRFHRAIVSNGFTMIDEDHCVYVKRSKDIFLILSLYVDDILLAGNDKEMIVATKMWLFSTFEMKDMGEASYVLGVKILRDRSRRLLGLSQETYIKTILERFQMQSCKPIDTPVAKGESLSLDMGPKTQEENEKMARVPYANAVGSLMYAMMCTRPDICYAVGLVSRYQSNPGRAHWKAVKRILRYLRGTADYTLCYQSSDLHLVGYCDADWGGDLDERKSTSGYAFMLSDGAISWSSKKQSCIALSTMEAEFVACSSAVQEAVWLRRFLQHLDVVTHTSDPVTIHCDSMAALAYAKDPKYHGRTKHIDVRFIFIRDILAQKEVILEHIPTSRMVADPLTKPIARDVYLTHVRALGLRRW